jgi:mRNA interferase MazF
VHSAIPILVVTGASGVGKTASVAALEARALPGASCFYFDSIGVPTPEVIERDFGGGERWQAHATKQWIARLLAQGSPSIVNVLDGQTRPSFVRAALEGGLPCRSRIVLLDCAPEVRRKRLASRGQLELANPGMDAWAAYLRGQADALQLPVIDTSSLAVEQVADALQQQVETLGVTGAVERIARGDVFWLGPDGSREEADYAHPHVVVQDDVFNHSRIATVVVCALTSNLQRATEPGNVLLDVGEANLPLQSVVVVSQISSVEKVRLGERIGSLSSARVEQILSGLRFQQASFFGRASHGPT